MPVKKIVFTAGERLNRIPTDDSVNVFMLAGDKVFDKDHNEIPSKMVPVSNAKEEIEFLISLAYEGANVLKDKESFTILKVIRNLETESLKDLLVDVTLAEEDVTLLSNVYGSLERRNMAFVKNHLEFLLQIGG